MARQISESCRQMESHMLWWWPCSVGETAGDVWKVSVRGGPDGSSGL